MSYQLVQTAFVVKEAPTQQVDTTSVFTAKFLGTLHIRNLLKKMIGSREISQFQVGQSHTTTYFIDVIDGNLCETIQFVLTFCSTQQHIAVAHQAEVNPTLQTVGYGAVKVVAGVGKLSNRNTSLRIVRQRSAGELLLIHDIVPGISVGVSRGSLTGIIVVLRLKSNQGPKQTRIQAAIGGLLFFKQVIQPGSSGQVTPAAQLLGSIITFYSMPLRGLRTDIHRGPLLIGTSGSVIHKLDLKQALRIVLIFSAFSKIVAIIGHQLIVSVLAGYDVLQDGISLIKFLAEHQGTCHISGSSTTSGTSFGPFPSFVARGQHFHGLRQVDFYLVEDLVLGTIGRIDRTEFPIGSIIRNQGNGLIVSRQMIIGEAPQEQCLSGNLIVDFFRHLNAVHLR